MVKSNKSERNKGSFHQESKNVDDVVISALTSKTFSLR